MANFEEAFDYMIQYEGSEYVVNPDDRGGATKFGISMKFVNSLQGTDMFVCENSPFNESAFEYRTTTMRSIRGNTGRSAEKLIKPITLNMAKWIYETYFWTPIYNEIENQDIANYVFDMTVNHGYKNSTKITQRACNLFKGKIDYLDIDGDFGQLTLISVNLGIHDIGSYVFLKIMQAMRESFYRSIVQYKASQGEFLNGWLKRAYGVKL